MMAEAVSLRPLYSSPVARAPRAPPGATWPPFASLLAAPVVPPLRVPLVPALALDGGMTTSVVSRMPSMPAGREIDGATRKTCLHTQHIRRGGQCLAGQPKLLHEPIRQAAFLVKLLGQRIQTRGHARVGLFGLGKIGRIGPLGRDLRPELLHLRALPLRGAGLVDQLGLEVKEAFGDGSEERKQAANAGIGCGSLGGGGGLGGEERAWLRRALCA